MFNHYLQVAFRYFRKNKEVSFVNVLGLTVGIIACLLLAHAIKMENSFDAFLQDTGLIGRFFYSASEESSTILKSKNDLEISPSNHITPNIPFAWKAEPNRQFPFVYLIITGVIFVLVIACVNLVNFTTNASIQTSYERGMRASLRVLRKHLSWRALAESLLLSFIGLLTALLAMRFVLPYLNHISGLSLTLDDMLSFDSLSLLLLSVLLTGIISGLYALFFSSFRPFIKLGNALKVSEQITGLHRTLVIFQFSIAIAMILGSIVVFDQLNYLTYKKISFDHEQEILFSTPHENLKKSVSCKPQKISCISETVSTGSLYSYQDSKVCKVQQPVKHEVTSVKYWTLILPDFQFSLPLPLFSECFICKLLSNKLFIWKQSSSSS